MMRKKRGYQRDTPKKLLRDYKLFAIACEGGKREPAYFRYFENMSPKIKVDIIQDSVSEQELLSKYETKSSPNWVLDRAIKYIEKEDLKDEDELWFVIDTDNWEEEQIRKIANYCEDYSNWHIVLSNPCFEVWLYFHKKTQIPNASTINCKQLKSAVSTLEKGGYAPLVFLPDLLNAIDNSEKIDSDKNYFLPKNGETKVYQLGKALMSVIGISSFEEFVKKILK